MATPANATPMVVRIFPTETEGLCVGIAKSSATCDRKKKKS